MVETLADSRTKLEDEKNKLIMIADKYKLAESSVMGFDKDFPILIENIFKHLLKEKSQCQAISEELNRQNKRLTNKNVVLIEYLKKYKEYIRNLKVKNS